MAVYWVPVVVQVQSSNSWPMVVLPPAMKPAQANHRIITSSSAIGMDPIFHYEALNETQLEVNNGILPQIKLPSPPHSIVQEPTVSELSFRYSSREEETPSSPAASAPPPRNSGKSQNTKKSEVQMMFVSFTPDGHPVIPKERRRDPLGVHLCPLPECGRTYRRRGDLKVHIRRNHSQLSATLLAAISPARLNKKAKAFPCPITECCCGYNLRRDLIRHLRMKHPEVHEEITGGRVRLGSRSIKKEQPIQGGEIEKDEKQSNETVSAADSPTQVGLQEDSAQS